MTKLYTAIIVVGEHDDYYEQPVFSSINEQTVVDWVIRYNNIVDKIQISISDYQSKGEEFPYQRNYEYVYFNEPIAIKIESELR